MFCPWCNREVKSPHFCDEKPKEIKLKIDIIKLWNKLFKKSNGKTKTSEIDKKLKILYDNREIIDKEIFDEEVRRLRKLKRVSDFINKGNSNK